MNTIFYKEERERTALIEPGEVLRAREGFPKTVVSTFSGGIIRRFAEASGAEIIFRLNTANGEIPIYKTVYGGREMAFYLSPVGAPAAVAELEEIIALGGQSFVFFGSCGVLDDERISRRLLVPTAAVRDEGTSYHYLPPADEVEQEKWLTDRVCARLEKCGAAYVCGKVWTTDAVYRETPGLLAERRRQGCAAVEMEYAALLACARFRGVSLAGFLYGADCVGGDSWEPRDLAKHGITHAERYMTLAMECGAALTE